MEVDNTLEVVRKAKVDARSRKWGKNKKQIDVGGGRRGRWRLDEGKQT